MSDTAQLATDSKKELPLLPVHFAIDTSYSMLQGGRIEAANQILPALLATCQRSTSVKSKLRFSVTRFSDAPVEIIPLSKSSDVDLERLPQFTADGSTNYGAVFTSLKRTVEAGYQTLKSAGYKVHRPTVILITDGEPTDGEHERETAWESLTDPASKAAPNVVAFGVSREVSEDTLKKYTSRRGRAFIVNGGVDAGAAFESIIELLVASIVSSVSGTSGASTVDEALDDGLVFDPDQVDTDFITPLNN